MYPVRLNANHVSQQMYATNATLALSWLQEIVFVSLQKALGSSGPLANVVRKGARFAQQMFKFVRVQNAEKTTWSSQNVFARLMKASEKTSGLNKESQDAVSPVSLRDAINATRIR